ncbi:type VI secretion system accessory protein TagJ [Albibacillus kandeliae]|uniref:type VI secretion system accessory protein TagJ n=1 Tax=Albibacillus kandeliae TaxID=2174228 RepID=UPI000D69CCA0|nr:type VI secretion system accessory protein TagJ [Albibacillus kandeliae]
MTPEEHLKAGDLDATLATLQDKVRKDPANPKLRIFLFQLLCVLGDWKRAITQLKLSAEMDEAATMMARTYREAIICEVYREKVFAGEKEPLIFGEPQEWLALLIEAQKLTGMGKMTEAADLRARAFDAAPAAGGQADGQKFEWIADADMRIGPVLEVIVNGRYFWLPFSAIGSLAIEPPSDLRDAVWTAASLTLMNGGNVPALIPTRYAGTTERGDAAAKLARATSWEDAGGETFVGLGQRLLATDEGDISLMDLRLLRMDAFDPEAFAVDAGGETGETALDG